MDKKFVYTDEVVDELKAAYLAAESDEDRQKVVSAAATDLGVKVESVRMKLVSLGIYKAKVRKTKNGEIPETKAKIVEDIAKVLDVNVEVVESLEKATKSTLQLVRLALTD